MPTDAKRATVAKLKDELAGSHAAIVADYRGLTVAELQAIRGSLRQQGVSYRIVKNRLARIAAREAGRDELGELLDGPTGLALGGADEVALARSFLDAVRPYRALTVRGGVIGERRIDADGVTRLASLPPRDVLLAQLAGGIASPLSSLASVISAPLRKLGYALAQLAAQKGAAEQAG
jgi:large subunit ribosomal protein L10